MNFDLLIMVMYWSFLLTIHLIEGVLCFHIG
jgi:hypothetical protein